MITVFETRSYWQGGFTEDQQKYYKEYCLSKKGKHLWILKTKLDSIARNLCSIYDVSHCCDKTCCYMGFKHLPFQCACNPIVTISSYTLGNYDFYDVEQIEEFILWKGAIETSSLLENYDDAPHKSEIFAILKFRCENYQNENGYIMRYLKTYHSPKKDNNALQEPMEEEIAENGIAIRSPIPFKSDQSSCYTIAKSGSEEVIILNFDPTIFDLHMNYVDRKSVV